MEERQVAESIGKLVGIVTALETQVQALLLAAAKAGMDPKDVRQAVEAIPVPVVPNLGRDAHEQAMAGFMRSLELAEAQLEDDPPKAGKGWLDRLLEALRLR
jgi:hypothetical protein